MNLTLYDCEGNIVRFHTEIFANDEQMFPDVVNNEDIWLRRMGGILFDFYAAPWTKFKKF